MKEGNSNQVAQTFHSKPAIIFIDFDLTITNKHAYRALEKRGHINHTIYDSDAILPDAAAQVLLGIPCKANSQYWQDIFKNLYEQSILIRIASFSPKVAIQHYLKIVLEINEEMLKNIEIIGSPPTQNKRNNKFTKNIIIEESLNKERAKGNAINKADVLLVDDTLSNIESAKLAGYQVLYAEENNNYLGVLENIASGNNIQQSKEEDNVDKINTPIIDPPSSKKNIDSVLPMQNSLKKREEEKVLKDNNRVVSKKVKFFQRYSKLHIALLILASILLGIVAMATTTSVIALTGGGILPVLATTGALFLFSAIGYGTITGLTTTFLTAAGTITVLAKKWSNTSLSVPMPTQQQLISNTSMSANSANNKHHNSQSNNNFARATQSIVTLFFNCCGEEELLPIDNEQDPKMNFKK